MGFSYPTWGGSWGASWGVSWGVGSPPIVLIDTHDGDVRRKRRVKKEIEERERKRRQLVAAYEHLVEGKPLVAEQIVEEFKVEAKGETLEARVDFDRLLDNIEAAQRLYDAWIDMDDEDVLILL